MSRKIMWQICHKNLGNKLMTKYIAKKMQRNHLTVKQVAFDLKINTERVRNWYYRNTGMTASDLFLLIQCYDFIRVLVLEDVNVE
ncbi:MAG: hypothetical protein F8N36_01745 [Desulfovibrio sp.]|uniref:hypothetical protein n=1 Tax=Desulfovibrio sp. TaxID=885 RepID=UPI00135DDF29|nr:hypothetical protein [Desulfovibrio sp.]MTJ91577.1 hypothetical protein [Desulfovibrio sp.]